jgi:hypothetical protein
MCSPHGVPFIPLIIVWQIFGRSTSFALGWATSLFFGQIPGNKGRVVSAAGVVSLAWVLLVIGVMPILVGGIVLDRVGALDLAAWDIDADEVILPVLGLVFLPPLVTLMGETSHIYDDVSLGRWVRSLPRSYPIALSLGSGLLLMLLVVPAVQIARRREGRRSQHLPMVVRDGRFDEVVRDVRAWLAELTGERVVTSELRGPASWPARALRYAADQYLRSVVRNDPTRLRAGRVEVTMFATNLSVVAPKKDVYRLRAALHKRLALTQAYLTWSEAPQKLEERLMALHAARDLPLDERLASLERLQEEIDAAEIKSDEWDVLYRLRLQVERDAYEQARDERPTDALREQVAT